MVAITIKDTLHQNEADREKINKDQAPFTYAYSCGYSAALNSMIALLSDIGKQNLEDILKLEDASIKEGVRWNYQEVCYCQDAIIGLKSQNELINQLCSLNSFRERTSEPKT